MSIEQCTTCLTYFDSDVEGDSIGMIPYCENCIPIEEDED